MAYVAKLTNTKVSPLTLYYRVPGSAERRQLISINVPSRALNYAVAFGDERHFEAFKAQNCDLINQGVIILGNNTKEKDAIKANEEVAKEEVKAVREAKQKTAEAFEKSVTNQKTKLKLEVAKADD